MKKEIKNKEAAERVKYIVEGRRWFDKINGNTYHSVTITDAANNKEIVDIPITYGYDDQYRHTAIDKLVELGLFKESDRFNHELIRKIFYFNVVDVSRKKDL